MTNNNEAKIFQQPMNNKEHKKAVKESQLSGTLKLWKEWIEKKQERMNVYSHNPICETFSFVNYEIFIYCR